MTDKTPAEQLAELPEPNEFECLERRFLHDTHTFRQGNTYHVADYPEINKAEVFMFWRAGWVKVAGWPEPPPRNPNGKIILDVHNIRHFGKSPRLGARNG